MSDPRECPHGIQFRKRIDLCCHCIGAELDKLDHKWLAQKRRADVAERALQGLMTNQTGHLLHALADARAERAKVERLTAALREIANMVCDDAGDDGDCGHAGSCSVTQARIALAGTETRKP